jgi:hypothetical protein
MRRSDFLIAGCAALAAGLAWIPGIASAAVYTGPGTALGSSPNDGAGISSVVVTNDNSNIYFTINASHTMASYIFYGIELQIAGQPVGDTSLSNNPYTAPNIGISSGVNSLIDTYGSGYDSYTWSGSSWTKTTAGGGDLYSAGGTGDTFATLTVPLSQLGLSIGNSFLFDVVSSYTAYSGGQPQAAYGALDSTGYPAETNGSFAPYTPPVYYDSASDARSTFPGGGAYNPLAAQPLYTVTAVPEPASLMVLGGSGLALLLRRRQQTAK